MDIIKIKEFADKLKFETTITKTGLIIQPGHTKFKGVPVYVRFVFDNDILYTYVVVDGFSGDIIHINVTGLSDKKVKDAIIYLLKSTIEALNIIRSEYNYKKSNYNSKIIKKMAKDIRSYINSKG